VAGSLTKSGTVGQVLGTPIVPPVEKYGVGYVNGAKAAKPGVKVLSACHPGGLAKGFTDPGWGNDTATQEMSQNADVIFAAGGQTGNGGLLAIASKGGAVLGIGVDTDQYLSLPEAKSILVSSAMKLITPGVYSIVKSVADDSFKGGNVVGAVGLAPYHDLASKVPADVQAKTFLTAPTVSPDELPAAGQKFYKDYEAAYGEKQDEIDPYAVYGYEAADAVLNSIDQGKAKRADVIKAFFSIKDKKSVLGTYSIDKDGDTTVNDFGRYLIKGGALKFNKTVKVEKDSNGKTLGGG